MCTIFNDPGGTGSDEVCFPVHDNLDSTDISMAGVYNCVKECMSFVM